MGIRGSDAEFKLTHKTRFRWPAIKMTSTGPKLKLNDFSSLPFDIADEHAAFLLRNNGGVPDNAWYTRKGETLQIIHFYGIGSEHDLCDAMLEFRDIMPRFSVPVARLESYDHDVALLITFPFDARKHFREPTKGREKKIWFFWNFEREIPEDDKMDDLKLASHSLSALVKALRPEPPKKLKRFDECDFSEDDFD